MQQVFLLLFFLRSYSLWIITVTSQFLTFFLLDYQQKLSIYLDR
ncbi:hypothetical protein VL20_1461 [Microcystis panniformis FACHB-1757]|uniref:Uncharacterized protein n=1 Tax=Microcystis panniformis FACHB-1757 TaxID=1638788 RepID=A0A0K1RXY6_9CHRO|nr:hypothetical protein VL20_1461 [Microcystis panniformis FACHB-1757]